MTNTGRPAYTNEQYQKWLYDLTPYLLLGDSLDAAITKADLRKHRTSIYEKYAEKDWFSDKTDGFQTFLGDMVNQIFVRLIMKMHKKITNGEELTRQESSMLRFFAVTHRSTIPYFVHKNEKLHVYADENGNIEEVINKLMTEEEKNLDWLRTQTDPSLSLEDLEKALLDTLE